MVGGKIVDDRVREQIEEILDQADAEDLLRQALAIDIPKEDGPWLRTMFRHAAVILESVFGKRQGTRMLPWWLFSLGRAYERDQHDEGNGGVYLGNGQ